MTISIYLLVSANYVMTLAIWRALMDGKFLLISDMMDIGNIIDTRIPISP